ncbi:hypothetical protein F4813DRAFT_345606 [Daldinia decipiens]|uniref:uncharacterized protein n=1 Tax=Daldinia decipiens TaxID=326647 RepID=UPI0020C34C0B|nr:uncharacterized protein F4813DRAFT_345606 [Daldinia decipiens]KAI1661740.1 hypothetical protein F4813DRAFT_345606 [Daldinia decipiens]
MSLRARLTSPATRPTNYTLEEATVYINHPGYENRYGSLLQFFRRGPGIEYDLVLYACCVVAGNPWPREMQQGRTIQAQADGKPPSYAYLSLYRDPDKPAISRPDNGILTELSYFLHVTDRGVQYPITPAFEHWVFPHGDIPPPWQGLDISPLLDDDISSVDDDSRASAMSRDITCRITKSHIGLEQAHIIPHAEDPWFRLNYMGFYATGQEVDNLKNTILLRADVHKIWDKNEIILIPKKHENTYHLVSHAFKTKRGGHFEIEELYHNRECQELRGIRREYLFARFAWAIFNSRTVTLLNGKRGPFNILLSVSGEDKPRAEARTYTLISQIPHATLPYFNQPNSSRSSSKKRSRSQANDHLGWYHSIGDNEIEYVDNGDGGRASKSVGWYYSIGDNQVEYVDDDDDGGSALCSAVGTDEDSGRIGRKRRRSGSFGSKSPPPLSQSLITVSSGGRSDSTVANPLDAEVETESGLEDSKDVALPDGQDILRNREDRTY